MARIPVDSPRRRKTDTNGRHKWDAAVKIVQVIGAVMLGIIAYYTKVNGDKAEVATAAAQKAAAVAQQSDSVLGDIHHLVDGTKSRLDTLVFYLQVDNTALRQQLRRHGISPREPDPKINP